MDELCGAMGNQYASLAVGERKWRDGRRLNLAFEMIRFDGGNPERCTVMNIDIDINIYMYKCTFTH